MIKCTLCGSALQMNPDGSGATCPECGIIYPLATLRRMRQASANPTPPDPAPVYAPPRPDPRPDPAPVYAPPRPAPVYGAPFPGFGRPRPTPVQPAPRADLPQHHIHNEGFGLSLAEHRQFPTIEGTAPGPKPAAPGRFASPRVHQRYAVELKAWEAAKRRFDEAWSASQRQAAEREAYFERFYEPISPSYSREEWLPYFEGILMEAFPEYTYRKNVSMRDLMGVRTYYPRAAFVLERGGQPVMAIFLTESKKRTRPNVCKKLEEGGLPALCFHTFLSNRRDYVIDRIRRSLKT